MIRPTCAWAARDRAASIANGARPCSARRRFTSCSNVCSADDAPFGFYVFEGVDEALVGADEVGGSFYALYEFAVHVLGLDEVVAVDEDHVGVGEEVVGQVILILELLLVFDGVAGDAEDDDAFFLEFFKGVAEAAGLDGAAGSVGAGVEEEDYGFALEISEGDVFSVLVLEGEVFDDVVGLHGLPQWLVSSG